MTLRWSRSRASTRSVSRSAGLARRIVSFSSGPRAARPAPSSESRIEKRSRYGRRMMSLTRSTGTVEPVWCTGIFAPFGSFAGFVPGLQSTKYSPMSDCGRVSQKTSSRMSPKPSLVSSMSISARYLPLVVSSRISAIFPARTPLTFTSAPSMSPNALSSSTV